MVDFHIYFFILISVVLIFPTNKSPQKIRSVAERGALESDF